MKLQLCRILTGIIGTKKLWIAYLKNFDFKYICYIKNSIIHNRCLSELISHFITFFKQNKILPFNKEKENDYNSFVKCNSLINYWKISFQPEFLKNTNTLGIKNVLRYFSTMKNYEHFILENMYINEIICQFINLQENKSKLMTKSSPTSPNRTKTSKQAKLFADQKGKSSSKVEYTRIKEKNAHENLPQISFNNNNTIPTHVKTKSNDTSIRQDVIISTSDTISLNNVHIYTEKPHPPQGKQDKTYAQIKDQLPLANKTPLTQLTHYSTTNQTLNQVPTVSTITSTNKTPSITTNVVSSLISNTHTNTTNNTIITPMIDTIEESLNYKVIDNPKTSLLYPDNISSNKQDVVVTSYTGSKQIPTFSHIYTNGGNSATSVATTPVKNAKYGNQTANLSNGKPKNYQTSTTLEDFPLLTNIMPTLLIILGIITIIFLLNKYTPIGLLFGRKRRRKRKDLRRIPVIREELMYETTYKSRYQKGDHELEGKLMRSDVLIKLPRINGYKKSLQKEDEKKKTELIEAHMEVLEECKNNEWELHKGDFLEICLHGFINDENTNSTYTGYIESTGNNIKKEKTIQYLKKQGILWNNWIENHRNIIEMWKKEEWFKILKNAWEKEQHTYQDKIKKPEENILKESVGQSIENKKNIWKEWISKQATLIEIFNRGECIKALSDKTNKKDNCGINEYNNASNKNISELENEKINEFYKKKNIIKKLMVQIHMMVLEESIKEDIMKNKELCIDNFIGNIYKKNIYDEILNVLEENCNDLKVFELEVTKSYTDE
ncbi:STP1 protein [Plasmodium ovale curtisi]|uniref:STP1 protein n=1 Tax=Plasmodium ovale curtisi TaxID=864141 RepID=A0A1A8WEX4_PLAOA|nr:STP1 protein [Plasmodium ovale curtisi]